MMECTPESGRCHSVFCVLYAFKPHLRNKPCSLHRIIEDIKYIRSLSVLLSWLFLVYLINCSKKGTSNTSQSLLTNEGRPSPENDMCVFTEKFLEMYTVFLSKNNNFLGLNIKIFTHKTSVIFHFIFAGWNIY